MFDKEILLKNITYYCENKNEYATNACLAAGVGKDFLANIKKGSTPSVEKVAKLAEYLGVTTSDLMGEQKETPLVNNDPELTAYLEELRTRPEMRMLFSLTKDATKEDVERAVRVIEALRKKSADDVDA